MTEIDTKEYWQQTLNQMQEAEKSVLKEVFDKRSSVTEKGGRPYTYSPVEIEDAMWQYFHRCIECDAPFTITGLCLAIGMSRMGFYRLEKGSNKEFVDTIKKGRGIVEFYWEYMGQTMPNPRLPIFILIQRELPGCQPGDESQIPNLPLHYET
jgi:hypothetical protein